MLRKLHQVQLFSTSVRLVGSNSNNNVISHSHKAENTMFLRATRVTMHRQRTTKQMKIRSIQDRAYYINNT